MDSLFLLHYLQLIIWTNWDESYSSSIKMLLLSKVLHFFFNEKPSPLDEERCSLLYVQRTEPERNSAPYWYPSPDSLTVLTFLMIEVCLIHIIWSCFLFFLCFEDITKLIKWYVVVVSVFYFCKSPLLYLVTSFIPIMSLYFVGMFKSFSLHNLDSRLWCNDSLRFKMLDHFPI